MKAVLHASDGVCFFESGEMFCEVSLDHFGIRFLVFAKGCKEPLAKCRMVKDRPESDVQDFARVKVIQQIGQLIIRPR